jgi:hypothetical protein
MMARAGVLCLLLWGAAGCGGGEANNPPQILPVLNPIAFQNFAPDPSAADQCAGVRPCTFDLQLVNTGNQPLEIQGVEVRGDVRCSIPEPPAFERDGQTPTLQGHESIFLHIEYTPGGATPAPIGEDNIDLVITSNASDYPQLDISICGCVVDGDPAEAPVCECNLNTVSSQNCGG